MWSNGSIRKVVPPKSGLNTSGQIAIGIHQSIVGDDEIYMEG